MGRACCCRATGGRCQWQPSTLATRDAQRQGRRIRSNGTRSWGDGEVVVVWSRKRRTAAQHSTAQRSELHLLLESRPRHTHAQPYNSLWRAYSSLVRRHFLSAATRHNLQSFINAARCMMISMKRRDRATSHTQTLLEQRTPPSATLLATPIQTDFVPAARSVYSLFYKLCCAAAALLAGACPSAPSLVLALVLVDRRGPSTLDRGAFCVRTLSRSSTHLQSPVLVCWAFR